ncbi:MAG: ABC transporter ATP-binding protein [Bacteroidia bacterium]|nr:ABC transporter ATP-binding protein [Bacteroidia bacterium]
MKILWKYLKPQSRLIFIALALATINQVFSMLDPWVGRNILDQYLTKYQNFTGENFLKGVGFWLSIGIGVAMVSRIAKNFQDYFLNVAIQKSGAQIFMDGIKHTLDLPYETFEDSRSGETLNILQKVRTDSERVITLTINLMYTSLVGVIFVFFASFTVHWLIAPVFLSAMAVVGVSSSLLRKRIKIIQKDIVKETSALAGTTTESLRNIELVKSLGLVTQEIRRISNNTLRILGLELKKVKKVRTLGFVQGTLVNLMRNCLLLFLSWMVFTARISPGMYIQFLFYTFFIFNPLQELGTFIQTWREAQISLEKYHELMLLPSEAKPEHPVALGRIESIAFEHVDFKHKSATRNALSNINFQLKLGQTVAFVGPSGSGKSTLVKLLVGLYKPASGELFFNGINSAMVEPSEIRNQLGLVSQESQLFSGTIRDNLLFVKPSASDAELLDVLHKAAAQSLMQRADKGLDTQIGEGGIKVSGGEKQRISIARALLRNPCLMVFDEATSALDSLTEREITQTVREVSQQRDRINVIIAHRLSTILHADHIYVLEKGKIIEHGTHAELLEEKGLYFAMWRQQIGEEEDTFHTH